MRKILFFLYDFDGTGVTRNTIAIANACTEDGYRAIIAVAKDDGPRRQDLHPKVKVVPLLKTPGPWSRPWNLMRAVGPLSRLLRQAQPHVFFSAGNHGHFAAILAHLAAGRAMPLVCRFSNDVRRPKARGWMGIEHRLVEFFAVRFQRMVVRHANQIITVSEELANRLRRLSPDHAVKITTIRNGVDPFPSEPVERPDHPWFHQGNIPIVLGIGRLKAQKNFEGLIKAAAQAARTRPLRLMILGQGSERARKKLLKLAHREGLGDHFALPGYQPNPEAYLRHSDLFVLSSHWEGAPNVLLEALATGTAIVSTREACGAQEILGGGTFGHLVSSLDIPAMAEAILASLDSRNPHQQVERKQWLENFSREQMLSGYMAMLAQISAKPLPVAANTSSTIDKDAAIA
jgi:glycosyltransferase involved in cell wall biosynthesis